jgi:hypothetical protein
LGSVHDRLFSRLFEMKSGRSPPFLRESQIWRERSSRVCAQNRSAFLLWFCVCCHLCVLGALVRVPCIVALSSGWRCFFTDRRATPLAPTRTLSACGKKTSGRRENSKLPRVGHVRVAWLCEKSSWCVSVVCVWRVCVVRGVFRKELTGFCVCACVCVCVCAVCLCWCALMSTHLNEKIEKAGRKAAARPQGLRG